MSLPGSESVYRPDQYNNLPNVDPIEEAKRSGILAPRFNSDPVKAPAHYTQGSIEVIDFIEQVVKDYPPEIAHHIGCIIKYVARAPHKGATQQDLEKASWYLTRAINKLVYVQRKP